MESIRQKIYLYLLRCGFSPVHKGFKLAIEALLLILDRGFKIKSLSASIYSELSIVTGISTAGIRRDIKNAVDYASLNAELDFFNEEFKHIISYQGSVSAAAFLFFVAEKMRADYIQIAAAAETESKSVCGVTPPNSKGERSASVSSDNMPPNSKVESSASMLGDNMLSNSKVESNVSVLGDNMLSNSKVESYILVHDHIFVAADI